MIKTFGSDAPFHRWQSPDQHANRPARGRRLLFEALYDKIVGSHFKEKEFVILLGNDCRLRHYHYRIKQEVFDFMVQLEIQVKEDWKPIIRYDTAHGFAHRDTYHADGRLEKTPLPMGDYNSILTFAEFDLRTNWELYRDRFLKEVGSND